MVSRDEPAVLFTQQNMSKLEVPFDIHFYVFDSSSNSSSKSSITRSISREEARRKTCQRVLFLFIQFDIPLVRHTIRLDSTFH